MATKKIDDFKSEFSDFLRPNLYAIYISPRVNFTNQDKNRIGMLCHEASFPFHTFTTNSYRYNNLETHFVNKIDYDPITFTFYVDRDNILLDFFDKWRKQIIDDSHRLNYFDNYTAQIEIEIFDRQLNTAGMATLSDAFPVNIGSIPLAYAQNDALMTMQVSFQIRKIDYDFFTVPKQQKQEGKPKSWMDDIIIESKRSKISKISLADKMKSYRKIIKNVSPYNILDKSKRISKDINKITGVSGKGDFDIVGKVSKLFKPPTPGIIK